MTNKGYAHSFAYVLPDFVTFILRSNTALDHQTFHAEPQSLLSRRDNTCERLRSLRGLRPYEESAERPSVYVERTRSVRGDILREQCWFISVNFSQDRRFLCVLLFSEAITPWLDYLRGSARKYIRRCENRLAL